MQEALNNLKKIQKWIDNSPSPSTFKTNNDFMKFLVEEVMSRAVYLLKIGVSLAPDTLTAKKGYTKHHAIIIGHMVRLFKLYQGFCIHVADCQEELASVFIRLIYETEIRLNYFLKCKNKNKALKSYVLTS
jgi:hypothetical protein